MSGRIDELRYRREAWAAPPGPRPRSRHRPLLTRGERFLFVFALFTFGLASLYTAVGLLTRVTPALFKGEELHIPGVHTALRGLPGLAKIEAPDETSSFNQRVNILFIGVDHRPWEPDTKADNADSIMVLSLDPVSETLTALSFPRDILIEIQGRNGGSFTQRINASFGYGYQNGENSVEAGAKQLIKDLKANFNIDIDHYVWMNIQGVEQVIDTLGGVTLNVEEDLKVPWDEYGECFATEPEGLPARTYGWWYSDDDKPENHRCIAFPPGPIKVNGFQAVGFGRYRQDDDFHRVRRQQAVLRAALQAVFARGLLSKNVFEIYGVYSKFVKTDIAAAEAVSFAGVLKRTSGAMTTYSIADPVNGVQTVFPVRFGEADVQDWDRQNVAYILSQVFTSPKYARLTVRISDGYGGETGAARVDALGRYLKYGKGLPGVGLEPEVQVQPTTTITLRNEKRRDVAEEIAGWLGVTPDFITSEAKAQPTDPDITIVIGRDFVLPGS